MNRILIGILIIASIMVLIADVYGVLPVQGFSLEPAGVKSSEFTKLELLAKGGDPEAQNKLGWMYDQGLETIEDPKKAAEWYLKSANQGFKQAQMNIGVLYELGRGVDQDLLRAEEWYSKGKD